MRSTNNKFEMQNIYSEEVARYLNNKFGDDFTIAEPYPYWMKAPAWDEQDNKEMNNNQL